MKLIEKVRKMNASNKQLFNNISASFLIKGIALLINIFALPAYMNYFNDNSILGVWFTILSLLTWILTFDLGIGNGLRNHLTLELINKDNKKIKQYISSGYIVVGIISLFFLITSTVLVSLLDWNLFFNIDKNIIDNNSLSIIVFLSLASVIIQFFLKLVISILNALQKTALANFIVLTSNLLILVYLLTFNSGTDITKFLYLSIVYLISVNLPLLITTILLFTRELKYAVPNVKYFESLYAKNIVILGSKFFLVQISFMLVIATNEIIITKFFDPIYVVDYQIYYKIFYTFVTLYSLASNPIWSAVTKAYAEGRYVWIKKIHKVLNYTTLVAGFLCFLIIPFLQPIINFWLGSASVKVDLQYSLIFATFSTMMMYIFSMSAIANGLGKLKPQVWGYSLAVILKIPFISFFMNENNTWILVVISNILLLIPYVFWQKYSIKKELLILIEQEK